MYTGSPRVLLQLWPWSVLKSPFQTGVLHPRLPSVSEVPGLCQCAWVRNERFSIIVVYTVFDCFTFSESRLECIASWREGNHNFLTVKVEGRHRATSVDEDKFRCAKWETVLEGDGQSKIYLTISEDASCNGLFSTKEGRALVLSRGIITAVTLNIRQTFGYMCNGG